VVKLSHDSSVRNNIEVHKFPNDIEISVYKTAAKDIKSLITGKKWKRNNDDSIVGGYILAVLEAAKDPKKKPWLDSLLKAGRNVVVRARAEQDEPSQGIRVYALREGLKNDAAHNGHDLITRARITAGDLRIYYRMFPVVLYINFLYIFVYCSVYIFI